MSSNKFPNPYKVFLGQIYANLPRPVLEAAFKKIHVPLPDCGLYMVFHSMCLVGYPVWLCAARGYCFCLRIGLAALCYRICRLLHVLKSWVSALMILHPGFFHGYIQRECSSVNSGRIKVASGHTIDACCAFATYSRPDIAAFCRAKFENYEDVSITPTRINVHIWLECWCRKVASSVASVYVCLAFSYVPLKVCWPLSCLIDS